MELKHKVDKQQFYEVAQDLRQKVMDVNDDLRQQVCSLCGILSTYSYFHRAGGASESESFIVVYFVEPCKNPVTS